MKNAAGEPILASVPFTKVVKVFSAIENVIGHAALDERYQRNKSDLGYSFTFVTDDKEPLARSEVYSTTYDRDQGIETVKKVAAVAEVIDRR